MKSHKLDEPFVVCRNGNPCENHVFPLVNLIASRSCFTFRTFSLDAEQWTVASGYIRWNCYDLKCFEERLQIVRRHETTPSFALESFLKWTFCIFTSQIVYSLPVCTLCAQLRAVFLRVQCIHFVYVDTVVRRWENFNFLICSLAALRIYIHRMGE